MNSRLKNNFFQWNPSKTKEENGVFYISITLNFHFANQCLKILSAAAMDFSAFSQFPRSSIEDEILIGKILLTHDPDGRRLDSEQLLVAVENVVNFTPKPEIRSFHIGANSIHDLSDIEVIGAEESLGQIICEVSNALLFRSSGERDLHERTMVLFNLLGNYRWDAKLVLVLVAFAANYGKFQLLMQLYPCNQLAASVSVLRTLPNNLNLLKPRFKALSLLLQTLIDVTKCVIKFESLPFRHVKLEDQAMVVTKSAIYLASYWVIRSASTCSSQITDLTAPKPEQVFSTSAATAVWQLTSLVYKLSSVYTCLSQQLDLCHQQIETGLYQKLMDLFQETHPDNQELLGVLLALKDDSPLKSSMKAKLDVSELKGKVVILLISKPHLLPLEGLFLLVQQTHNHPHHSKLEKNFKIVWIPISLSYTWTPDEVERFNFLSNSLPWYSLRRPWSLNSAVVTFIKENWSFKDDPVMVVLDSQGKVTNLNAIDMFLIWGTKAYPFSSIRENQLWEEEKWSMRFLVDEIDPRLSRLVEEGKNICIYGSDSLDWIREFNAKVKEIRSYGLDLETVYVGKNNPNEQVRCILDFINTEIHTNLLSFSKLHFFWIRLQSMRSILKPVQSTSSNHIHNRALALLDSTDEGWAVLGNKTDIVNLQGEKLMECLNKFPEWRVNVPKLGFVGAVRSAIEPPVTEPCNNCEIKPYDEQLVEGVVFCEKCKRPMKKFVLYE